MVDSATREIIGRRVHVIGNSCSGKSTVGTRLARAIEVPLVELDQLNWEPNWVALHMANPRELERRIAEATAGNGWVVAGSYRGFCQRTFWPRLESVVWLDPPLALLVWRVLIRSWRRWRSKELLWGTNYERFWPQLMLWRGDDSLLWWILSQHRRKRRAMISDGSDPRWSHVRFIHLRSTAEIERFLRPLEETSRVADAAVPKEGGTGKKHSP